jgi:hypothetical protein
MSCLGEVDLPVRGRHPRVRPCALGKSPAERLPVISAFARWMRDWAVRPNDWKSNLIVLGDFNLDRIGFLLNEAFLARACGRRLS